MNDQIPLTTEKNTTTSALMLKFLGSMNLAITLLVAMSVASIIGTVLQQNLPYTDYVIKFGPFWFEVFNTLGLYDVYSALWFLLILTFLVISTSVCIYRNAPKMIREMSEYREGIQRQTLQNYTSSKEWLLTIDQKDVLDVATKLFKHNGFSSRKSEPDGQVLISGMKGKGSRLGYVLTHLAIVMICIGGLIDGNAILKFREMAGQIIPETENIPANTVPDISRLGIANAAFRGNVSIPEGGEADVLFINYKDGYLVQELPFSIEVKDFRIEHYQNGQPKSFESDLVVHDKRLDEPLVQTISVNHPLIYDGYSIYQASFGDGGSLMNFLAWPLTNGEKNAMELSTIIGSDFPMKGVNQGWMLETSDFRLFNINPSEDPNKKFKNVGPSVQFKLRNKTGEAKEYLNYMLPLEREGKFYYLSGVRNSPSEEFQYLHIPIDDAGGINRFMAFQKALSDEVYIRGIAETRAFTESVLPTKESAQIIDAMVQLAMLFKTNGIEAVVEQVKKNVPEEKREEVAEIYVRVLQQILGEVYVDILVKEGVDVSEGVDEKKADFFDDASTAISAIGRYGSPVFFQLQSFEHRQASGLQIAKAPGKNLVYPGCGFLILGVFLMFYAPQRRLWMSVKPSGEGLSIVLAGTSLRNKADFSKEYETIRDQFDRVLRG